jgi:hypothetical protein
MWLFENIFEMALILLVIFFGGGGFGQFGEEFLLLE